MRAIHVQIQVYQEFGTGLGLMTKTKLTLALAGKIRIAGHRRSRQPFSMQEANM
jgi:hypothetical protein